MNEKQIRKILDTHFPGEQWEDFTEHECRLALAQRILQGSEIDYDNDGQAILYTGLYTLE